VSVTLTARRIGKCAPVNADALAATRAGKVVRAAAVNPEMVSVLGINTTLLYALVFAVGGGLAGLAGALVLIAVSPEGMHEHALFPLRNPGLVSIPLGFLGAVFGTLVARDPQSEEMFDQLQVRANTGIGAEV